MQSTANTGSMMLVIHLQMESLKKEGLRGNRHYFSFTEQCPKEGFAPSFSFLRFDLPAAGSRDFRAVAFPVPPSS